MTDTSSAAPKLKNERILVVDDEPSIRELVVRWLADDGYNCDTADSVDSALMNLAQTQYALVLSDINMPGKIGLELLAAVHHDFPDTAVMMATAISDRAVAIRAVEGGAYGYLIKPFDENELLINVANAMERRSLVLASRQYERILEEKVRTRTAELRRTQEQVVARLVAASEWRDTDTGAHIRRIGLYSAILAEALGWSASRVEDMQFAATMHDIGKIGVPDSILLKTGTFTREEHDTMRQHTIIGARILSGSQIPLLDLAAEIALSHHEKWDGTGYPNRLAGEAIPESGRIVAIADVFDALLSMRPYKAAFSEQQSLEIMRRDRGKHFDPRIFDCFFENLDTIRKIRRQISESHPAYEIGPPTRGVIGS